MARKLRMQVRIMSKKVKIPGVVRELRTAVNEPIRREPARPAGLYLLELRHHAASNSLPRRRLMITIDGPEWENGRPKPIKITHV
jgi:hypothetical protein